jgi:UDP-N-acetyl-D-mannosaminuronate dehydrogenase
VKLNSQEADLRVEVFEAYNQTDALEKLVMLITEAYKDKIHDTKASPSAEVITAVLNPENDPKGDLMFLEPYFTSLPPQQFKRRQAVPIRAKKTTVEPFQVRIFIRCYFAL